MTFIRGLAAILLAAIALPVAAQKACSKADEATAGKAVDRISSWETLHATWKTWRHCDSGPTADLFTEALLRLVVDWKQIEKLAAGMKEADYREFVLSHLTGPAAQGDVDDVYARARRNCPKGHDAWCMELANAVKPPPPPPMPAPPGMPGGPTPPAPGAASAVPQPPPASGAPSGPVPIKK